MKKEQNRQDENCTELPIIPNEPSVLPNKPVVPKQSNDSPAVDMKTAREEMEKFKQPHCWIKTEGLTQDAVVIWNKLKTSQMVPYTYPVRFGEKRGTIQTATIDGLQFVLRSGYSVNIPMEIYGLLQNKVNVEDGAGSELRIENQGDDVRDALTR